MTKLLNVVSTGSQSGHRNLTTGIGGVRTGYERCAGTVTVNTELPTGQILTVFRFLGQTQIAGVQLVVEADRSSATCRDGDLLRIGAGAVILSADVAVRMSNLLNIVGAGEQAGNGDLTTGIGGMRTRDQG